MADDRDQSCFDGIAFFEQLIFLLQFFCLLKYLLFQLALLYGILFCSQFNV